MGSVGDAYDNALRESFFATLECELLDRERFRTPAEAFTPHQFFSEEEIEDVAAGTNPEITLVETDEVYRCAVVGRKGE